MLRLAQQKEEKGRAHLDDSSLIAGKGLGEDRRNKGGAARPVGAAGEGRASEKRVRERRESFKKQSEKGT